MPLPCPAPAWMSTLCPARVSSSTPTGIMATRVFVRLDFVGNADHIFAFSGIISPQ